jgi:hypothetical protein
MRRIWLILPLVLTFPAIPAVAQRFVGGGSTPQGDYLRGLGVAAAGMGLYNVNTARAEAIQADTAIKVDTYMNTVFRAARDNWTKLDRQREEQAKANYNAILKRIQDSPENLDVFNGRALNAAMKQLNNPAIQESSFRSAPVPIPREMLRRIPFKMDEKGLVFSIQRLTARGKGKWPVAFQQDDFAAERKAYDKAIDQALGEMIDGKVNEETIKAYDAAVAALSKKLQVRFGMKTDLLYTDANTRVHEMEKASRLLKTLKMQPVMAELDRYTGQTVNDLRLFMLAHNLLFAAADSADERRMYTELYASIDTVRRMMIAQRPNGGDQ